MLEIKNLRKDYLTDDKPFTALSDISLSFPEVQFVTVLGPSGCGKTTLLNCIGGLDKISDGDITIDENSLPRMNDAQLDSYRNNYIGFIFVHLDVSIFAVRLLMSCTKYNDITIKGIFFSFQDCILVAETLFF